jgi:hypothetical protein
MSEITSTIRQQNEGAADEQILILDASDDAVERAAGRQHNPALTLGFCTYNLIECPIGSRT